MTDYGTIKIPREAYERHNERRKEMDLEWGEYIDGQVPDDVMTLDKLCQRVERMDYEVSNLVDAVDGAEGDEAERIMGRLDDLESHLPRKVAEELGR